MLDTEFIGNVVELHIVIGNTRGADGNPQGVVMLGGVRKVPSPVGETMEELGPHEVAVMMLEAIKFSHQQEAKAEVANRSLIQRASGPLPPVMRS